MYGICHMYLHVSKWSTKCRSENRVFVKSHTGKMRRCSDFAIPSSDHFRFSTRNFLLEVKTQSPLESCWKISVNNRRQGFHAMVMTKKGYLKSSPQWGPILVPLTSFGRVLTTTAQATLERRCHPLCPQIWAAGICRPNPPRAKKADGGSMVTTGDPPWLEKLPYSQVSKRY